MPPEEDSQGTSTISTVLQLTAFVLVILATLTGNCLVCVSVFVFRHLRSNTNLMLVSLAVTDLCMVVIMVLNATTLVSDRWIFGRVGCHGVASVGLTLAFISILHLCLLSVDRYIAIFKPFRYPFIVTRWRISLALPLLWMVPSIVVNLPSANFDFRGEVYNCLEHENERRGTSPYILVLVFLFVLVPFSIIAITNAKVFQVAFRHARRLSRLERSLRASQTHIDGEDDQAAHIRQDKDAEFRSLKREIRSAKTFAVVVGVFLLCYVPFFTAGTYRKYAGSAVVPDVVIVITMWVAFSNSFCNPLVYGLRYAPFRKAFKTLCSRAKNKFRGRNTNSTTSQQSKADLYLCKNTGESCDTKL